jgi:TPR repeat protein
MKIKESPYIKNTSIFVITGKGMKRNGGWSGKMFNQFPEWMQDVEHLLGGDTVKGLGSYEVFIKKEISTEINEETLKRWGKEAKKRDDTIHKLALAGFCMKSNEVNDGKYYKTHKCYKKAKDLYSKADNLGSLEAKLCLGVIYSIGLIKHKPTKAKKLFKKVAKKTKDEELARIATRNVATLFHSNKIEKIKTGFLELFSFLRVDNKPLHLKKAEKWYNKSLELEDSQSAYQLGLLYENNFYESINEKTGENKKKAEELFEKAVQFDNDNLYAKAKLGRILINNNKDVNEGLKMLEDAAEKELNMGQTYLGEFYEKEKDYGKAVEFYSKAARQNRGYYSHAAQYRLNKLKDKGLINTDIEDILEYYRNERKYGYIENEEAFEKIR